MSEKQKQQKKEKQNKRMKQKCIKYLINKSEKEASIYKCSSSSIKEIKIPLYIHHKSRKYTITGINHGAFMCLKIKSIKFPSDSKIQLIDNYSLCGTSIKSITIPSHVTKIGISAFSSCTKLKIVKFNDDSKLQVIEDNSFFGTKIKYIKIPSQVTMIGSDAFSHCKRLKRIEFENDSKLQSIGKGAFASSLIRSFSFPLQVKDITFSAFSECYKLKIIEVSINTKSINFSLVGCHLDTIIMVPVKVGKCLFQFDGLKRFSF